MAHNATWQLAQELLIHIIEFLGNSPADLRACALVSRSFVHAAQSQIFQEISLGSGAASVHGDRRPTRLLETLHAAPHLAQYVRRLRLQPSRISGSTLSEICCFPLPRLKAVFCSYFDLSPVTVAALRHLLALPTLLSVEIACHVPQRLVFVELWSLCSPSIKHLDLKCDIQSAFGARDLPDRLTAPARLTSLCIGDTTGVRDWVNHPLCPFDFSAVAGLSVSIYVEVVHWPKIAPILQNITVFAFTARPGMNGLDLSVFGSLENLRIRLSENLRIGLSVGVAWRSARAALLTIPPSNNIRKIVLSSKSFSAHDSDELARTLTSLPLHHAGVLDFEMPPNYYNRAIASLPPTIRNDTRRTDDDPHWFERMTRDL
ncbi:hypothetical protein B0H15DRAFT_867596 [Mycena belliarum]|uniref:F-box domain-containing protein n=1 Tax=Mycena belliarum TaxID=1033014 RepID=A0AAD6XF11_9AGAR|nr:hypothetical protein B0H15DRAFT_867596 [Mycena belliae]